MDDLTIEQLAERVGMSVRNVRAYAGRGLIDPPRLVGRTGYYDEGHVRRLLMIRGLLDRGYTLGAVQDAIKQNRQIDRHPLELYHLLADPSTPVEPETVSISELTALSGQGYSPDYLEELSAAGMVEVLDDETVRLLRPGVVRAGAEAVALGLERQTVLEMFPVITEHLTAVAEMLVSAGERDVWRPFTDAGLPAEGWEPLLERVEGILPLASRAVLSIFREVFTMVLDEAMQREASRLGVDLEQFRGQAP